VGESLSRFPGLSGGSRASRMGAIALVTAVMAVALVGSAHAQQPPVGLGTAESFAVLAGSAVTNTGPSVVNGDLGVHPGTSVSGFPPGTVNGTIHAADAVAAQAQSDLTTAYNDAAGRTPAADLPFGDIGGLIFTPGVYRRSSSLLLTGDVALDAQGDPNAVFIFQVGSTLTTASSSRVLLRNGAQACNVFWQIGSSATLGTNTSFKGNILALSSITMNTGATLVEGRALARNGAVTLDTNTITRARCATPPPGGTTPPPDGTTPPPGGTTPPPGGTTPPPGGFPPPAAAGSALFTTLPRSVSRTVLRRGTTRCVRRAFRAFVTGVNISRVTFTLNGRRVGTLSGRPPFEVAVRANRPTNVLRARVTFTDATRPVTLTMRFRACGVVRRGRPGRGFTG
jgi:hypothetical protein